MAIKVTFGMNVLNGEPFTRYNLRSLYPFAHEIIVVEGACRTAKAVSTPDGHSLDNTVEIVRHFQGFEDPEKKVTLVTAQDEGFADGFWPEKTEMSQAFAKRATGNYLWEIASDEFYREEDMAIIMRLLAKGVGQMSFRQHSFWGGIDHVNNSLFLAEFALDGIPRVFAWEPGFRYKAHRPPTVVDQSGKNVILRGSVSSRQMSNKGIYLYHYCLVFPSQVSTKVSYYSTPSREKISQGLSFGSAMASWHETNFREITRPFHLHNVQRGLSWIRPFHGNHPAQVQEMMSDIRDGRISHEMRRTDDIERLMQSRSYRLATIALDTLVAIATSRVGYPLFRVGRGVFVRTWRLLG